MISSKKELDFYMRADLMMNRGYFKMSFAQHIKNIIDPDYVIDYLRIIRKMAYYNNRSSFIYKFFYKFYSIQKNRLGSRLGFYISENYGYGLVIPHYGTIVAGGQVGNYAVLHTSICITGNVRTIGDGLYMSTGAKITGFVKLGNYVSVGPNSVVSRSCKGDNIFIEGTPANVKLDEYPAWYDRDGLHNRMKKVEELRKNMGINKL